MPVRWMTTPTGERFLQADRKNRVERARLDLQLKIYEREKMRNWGLAERERKVLLTNMESIRRTSGTSNMGVAPVGPKNNSYERSMHSRSAIRLSEKRLMEWKICEQQLQRFLKQKAVPADNIQLSDSRPFSSRSAWADDSKTSVSAKEKHGGKVEKERAEVQKRVSEFLYNGLHIVDSADRSKKDASTKLKGEGKMNNGDFTKKKGEKESEVGRQRHLSDVVRPHTAYDQTDSAAIQTKKRPASAFVPKKSQKSQFLITKGDVYMDSGLRFMKISGSGPDTPRAQVNNYVEDLTRSYSPISSDSESDQDVFIDDRLYAETRINKPAPSDNDDARSETKSILSDKSSKKLNKHVSIASFLDQLTEEELEKDLQTAPQSTSRITSANSHSATSPRGSLSLRPGSAYSRTRETTPTVLELDDEDEDSAEQNKMSKAPKPKDFENPNMYELRTVNQTVKSAMVFSKSARKKALENLVKQNSPDKRELIRMERLQNARSRSAMLSTISSRFNII